MSRQYIDEPPTLRRVAAKSLQYLGTVEMPIALVVRDL